MPRYGQIDPDYAAILAGFDPASDGPVHMVNLMEYRERADYADDEGHQLSGREADERYTPTDLLRRVGARLVFLADVVEATERWDRVAVVRYPTRRAFVEMTSRRDYGRQHRHKDAGLARSTVMATLPIDGVPGPSASGRLLLEISPASTAPSAAPSRRPLRTEGGGEPGAPVTFGVEGTIVGDGRSWATVVYREVDHGSVLAAPGEPEGGQALIVHPTVERWA